MSYVCPMQYIQYNVKHISNAVYTVQCHTYLQCSINSAMSYVSPMQYTHCNVIRIYNGVYTLHSAMPYVSPMQWQYTENFFMNL